MINPRPPPHRGSLRNLELIYLAQSSQTEGAVLWLDISAVLHLADVSLSPGQERPREYHTSLLHTILMAFLLHSLDGALI